MLNFVIATRLDRNKNRKLRNVDTQKMTTIILPFFYDHEIIRSHYRLQSRDCYTSLSHNNRNKQCGKDQSTSILSLQFAIYLNIHLTSIV